GRVGIGDAIAAERVHLGAEGLVVGCGGAAMGTDEADGGFEGVEIPDAVGAGGFVGVPGEAGVDELAVFFADALAEWEVVVFVAVEARDFPLFHGAGAIGLVHVGAFVAGLANVDDLGAPIVKG